MKLFALGNAFIMPFWLSAILAPRSSLTRWLLRTPLICAVLALLYGVVVVPSIPSLLPLLAKPEFEAIRALLSTPVGTTAAWLHFLAFDLFVGRWIWQDALERDFPSWALGPILATTLMFGPLGMLIYLGARSYRPTLRHLSLTMAILIPLLLLGLALDPRTVTGLPVWIKPLKFAFSLIIYCLTLEAILTRLDRQAWATQVRRITSICLSIEMVVIFLQAARGTTSHFNVALPLDGMLFALMGGAIVPVWVAAMVTTWMLWRDRTLDRELSLSLRWGLFIAVIGMGSAWKMVTAGQHTFGAPDGGPGLPLLGWSTLAGDLRVAHFVGLHAMQLVPLLVLLGLPAHPVGITYLGWVLLLIHQALMGQPFCSFSPLIAGWMSLGSLVTMWQWRRISKIPVMGA